MQDSTCGTLIPVRKPVVPVQRTHPFDDHVPLRGSDLAGGLGGSGAGAGAGGVPPGLDIEGMLDEEECLESSSLSSWIDELLHEPPCSAPSPRSFAAADKFLPGFDTPELDVVDHQAAGESSSSEIGGKVVNPFTTVPSSDLGYASGEVNRNLETQLQRSVVVHQLLPPPRAAAEPPLPPPPLAAAREALSNLLKQISFVNGGTDSSRRAPEFQASIIPGNSIPDPNSIGPGSVDAIKSSLRRTSSASDALFSLQSQTSASSAYQIRNDQHSGSGRQRKHLPTFHRSGLSIDDGHQSRSLVGGQPIRSFTQSWPVSKVLGIPRKSSASSLPLKFADTSLASGSRSGIHHFSAPAHSPPLPSVSFPLSHHPSFSAASLPEPFPPLAQPTQGPFHIPSSQITVSLSSVPAVASNGLSPNDSIPETIVGAFLSSPSPCKQQFGARGRDLYDKKHLGINSYVGGVPPAIAAENCTIAGATPNQRPQKSQHREPSVSQSHVRITGTTRYDSESNSSRAHGTAVSVGGAHRFQSDQAGPKTGKAESQAQDGLRLVQLLLECAEAVSKHEVQLAHGMLLQLQAMVSTSGDSMQRVAACFTEALRSRLLSTGSDTCVGVGVRVRDPASNTELPGAYQILYQACPYFKFAHFTSNQAILEAFEGEPRVHILDLDIVQGYYQWPALMQSLAARQGGPPILRLTGVGVSLESVQETGKRLSQLAECLHLPFSFQAIAKRLEDLKAHMLQREIGEALAVNSVNCLHRLLTDHRTLSPLVDLLRTIYAWSPKTVTIVEHEASHNGPTFLCRFLEALHYYSAIFDSLEATLPRVSPERTKIEQLIFAGEITNIIACEGSDRVERHEKLDRWRRILESNGFRSTPFSSKAFHQIQVLLGLYPCDGYSVVEDNGCLLLGWQDRPVIAASCWHC